MGMEQKEVIESLAQRRITAIRIGEILDVTEKTARKRLADGLDAADLVAVCRALSVNPIAGLVALGHVNLDEVFAFIDSDGKLLATADEHELIVALADASMTTSELADLVARRAGQISDKEQADVVHLHPGKAEWPMPESAAASRRTVETGDRGPVDVGEENQDPGATE